MKLYRYIHESEDVAREILDNADKMVLKAMHNTGCALWRTTGNKSDVMFKYTHKSRTPRDTRPIYNAWANEWFEQKFGWRARSEHILFCFKGRMENIPHYNYIYIIFPTKVEKMIYSGKVRDFTVHTPRVTGYENKISTLQDRSGDIEKHEFFNMMDKAGYKEIKNIQDYFRQSKKMTEIMIKCKTYYAVRRSDTDTLGRMGFIT